MVNLELETVFIDNNIVKSSYCIDGISIYKAGGQNETTKELSNLISIFTPGKNSGFVTLGKLPNYLQKSSMFYFDNRLYIVCGMDKNKKTSNKVYSIDIKNIPANEWREECSFPESTYSVSIARNKDSFYFLGNGYKDTITDKGSNIIYKAKVIEGELAPFKKYITLDRYYKGTTLLNSNENIITCGGVANLSFYETIIFKLSNPSKDGFVGISKLTDIVSKEKLSVFFTHKGNLYRFGGVFPSQSGFNAAKKLLKYSPLPNQEAWQIIGEFPGTICDAIPIIHQDYLYLFEGNDGEYYTSNVYRYKL